MTIRRMKEILNILAFNQDYKNAIYPKLLEKIGLENKKTDYFIN